MLKIVLDTNVLVSAFLKPRSKPARILRLVLQGDIEIVANESIETFAQPPQNRLK